MTHPRQYMVRRFKQDGLPCDDGLVVDSKAEAYTLALAHEFESDVWPVGGTEDDDFRQTVKDWERDGYMRSYHFKLCAETLHPCGHDAEQDIKRTTCESCGGGLKLFRQSSAEIAETVADHLDFIRVANEPDPEKNPGPVENSGSGEQLAPDEVRANHFRTVMFSERLASYLFVQRCFQKPEGLIFEYIYCDEDMAMESAHEWLIDGDDDSTATIRPIKLDANGGMSIEAEQSITLKTKKLKHKKAY